MSKAVFNISRAQDSRQFAAPPGYQAWGSLTSGKFSGELADGEVLAHVHRCEAEVPTAPLFLITHPSGPSRTLCTVSAPAGGAAQRKEREYTVHGPAGDYAGRIVHGRSPRGIRQAWRIHTPAGTQLPPATRAACAGGSRTG